MNLPALVEPQARQPRWKRPAGWYAADLLACAMRDLGYPIDYIDWVCERAAMLQEAGMSEDDAAVGALAIIRTAGRS